MREIQIVIVSGTSCASGWLLANALRREMVSVGVVLLRNSTDYTCRGSTDALHQSICDTCAALSTCRFYQPSFFFVALFPCFPFYCMKTVIFSFFSAGRSDIILSSFCRIIPPSNRCSVALALFRTLRVLQKCSITLSLHLCIFSPFWHLS